MVVFNSGGRTYAIVTAYNDDNVQIMDVTDPVRPAPVSATYDGSVEFATLNGPHDVAVFDSGGRIYAIVTADNDNGVQIMDVTDPARPVPVSAVSISSDGFDTLRWPNDVEVFGSGGRTYAIVTGQNDDGVQIMDITDPGRPAPVSSVFDGSGGFDALGGAEGVEVFESGDRTYAIITTVIGGIHIIIDITDPTNPTLVWPVDGAADGLSSGLYAFC